MSELLKMAPAWARSLVGIVAAIVMCLALLPPEKIVSLLVFFSQPPGIFLLYALGLAVLVVCAYLLINGRMSELRGVVDECQKQHDRCEERTKKLVAVVLDFAADNKASAIQAARELMLE